MELAPAAWLAMNNLCELDFWFFHPLHFICETCEQMQSTKNFYSSPLPKTEVARN